MQKQIYLVRGSQEESYAAFHIRIQQAMQNVNQEKVISRLSYTLTSAKPPRLSIIPFIKKKVAAISVWQESELVLSSISAINGFVACYSVTEALPVRYEKNWENGAQTPGVCLLTLFKAKKNMDQSTFIDRWHNSHTPLSLKIHPLWHYNRNAVDKKLPNDTDENWGGIVEEHMRSRSELLNPFKFFGNPLVIIPRMIHVYTDTRSFIDYPSMEPYLVSEYHLR